MITRPFRKNVVVSLVALSALGTLTLLPGCSNEESGHMITQPMSTQDVEKRIKAIQDDPHMPQAAKSAQIGQLRAAQGGGMKQGK